MALAWPVVVMACRLVMAGWRIIVAVCNGQLQLAAVALATMFIRGWLIVASLFNVVMQSMCMKYNDQ